MDENQKRFERDVGDAFFNWFNQETGSHFRFLRRAERAPDLVYKNDGDEVYLEVTTAYYDDEDAQFLWKRLRKLPDAPKSWSGKDMDEALIENINKRLREKCQKQYGSKCFLVVYMRPTLTTAEELQELLHRINAPLHHPFMGIYLTGNFGISTSGSRGGYRCWKIDT